jgi:hypothetical protein
MRGAVVRLIAATGALGILIAGTARAQIPASRSQHPRSTFGINGVLAHPVGEFRNFVEWGGGLSLYGVVNLQRSGPLGVRFDGSMMLYGHESFQRPFDQFIQRVQVRVNTDNYIFSFGVGPQLTLGHGPIRPYVYGTAGFAYFATVSSVGGSSDDGAFASTTNYDDFTGTLTGGGGLLVRLSRGRHPVSLDLSAQTVRNGRTRYLREGSLLESPDGSISFIPIESEANLVTFRIGVAIGV